jgi:hypothetical protein
VDSPSIGAVSPCLGFWFLNPSAYQVCLHCIDCHILYILFLPCILFEEPPFLSLDVLLVTLRNFCMYIHSRDDRESMSLLFCLGIVKPLSLRTSLLLSYMLGLNYLLLCLSMLLLFFYFIVFNKKKKKFGEKMQNFYFF